MWVNSSTLAHDSRLRGGACVADANRHAPRIFADGGDGFLSILEYPMASSASASNVSRPRSRAIGARAADEDRPTFIGKDTFDGHDVDVYQKVVVIP